MKVSKWIFILFFGFVVYLYALGSNNTSDSNNYSGQSIDTEWDNRSICQTAIMVIKDNFFKTKSDQLYNSKCTVSKLTAPLPGKFSIYEPYAVSWPNDVAARVFITTNGLKVSGISEKGIPFSWNVDHRPIVKTETDFAQECTDLFKSKVKAQNISIVNVKKYDDLSGANVELKYIDPQKVPTTGSCLFDRTKMTTASSKVASDKYSKNVYSND
ncbi:hypothetical protein H4J59_11090 [Colwellia sp. MB02u-10]|uniref:hypothetical protein n=1 Tax=Colwellia sp. MB02u-10 TaxID=2759828 RepID=UPI0015F4230D|nr:hypothetical protein [Colwellia sp. MB02u-10]MBA6341531.1 hypothetical protein [Colwellia sp. MB02u-10]